MNLDETRAMTKREAFAEARRRWDERGYVSCDRTGRDVTTVYRVGYRWLGRLSPFTVQGQGDSWRAAFEDADRRAAGGQPIADILFRVRVRVDKAVS